jgi:hypothetical protein
MGTDALVDLHWSADNGATWTAISRRASTPGAVNTYAWRTPRTPATIRVRVRSVSDTSMSDQATGTLSMLALSAPAAGSSVADGGSLAIAWASAGAGETIRIQYATSDSLGLEPGAWVTIAESAPNTGSYTWTVDAWPTSRARIRVQSRQDIHLQAISNTFTITAE